ncbi:MAG: hypothetical protein M3122_02700 [Actinomycetota bacterium]|nr:hypothetical protein [Actinomycetota bacterium]
MKGFVLLMSVLAMAVAAPALAQTGQEVVPGSGGGDGATLLTLGFGVALIACGLLVRRVFGKF